MRNLCCKCPHYYEQHGYECDYVDWGCTAFGREFENRPSFDDGEGNADFEEWGCNEKQNRINYALMRIRKKDDAFWKSQKKNAFKYKDCTVAPRTEKGYKLFTKSGSFIGYSLDYKPIMKGGHRHNHIYNVCNRITFRGKKSRRVKPDDKKYFVSIFWENIALMPDVLNKILANKRKRK